ncbi:MAG: hypothetical protein HY929_07610 [Euryarchaeota archaeon]|nr:hypothetical protein [Euryarchaeota archaeon]
MSEPTPSNEASKIQAEFERIKQEVSKGNYSLKELGFWKVVSEVKKDLNLIEKFADQIGKIDQEVHRKRWFAVNIWVGHLIEILGTIFGLWLIYIGLSYPKEIIGGISLLVGAFTLSTTLHPLTHFVVGRLVGIQFLYYFPHGLYIFFRKQGKGLKIEPSLKLDYATYLRASPLARVVMHASGPIVTKIMPFTVAIIAIQFGASIWAITALWTLFATYIITDIFYSAKFSDWSRVLQEWRYLKLK